MVSGTLSAQGRVMFPYRELAGDYSLLPHEKMLELTTIDAARVVGLDHMIGSLEAGKRADIITINLMNPRLTPNFNIIHSLVMSAQGCDMEGKHDGVYRGSYDLSGTPVKVILDVTVQNQNITAINIIKH